MKSEKEMRVCPECLWELPISTHDEGCPHCGYALNREIKISPGDRIRVRQRWKYRDARGVEHEVPALEINYKIFHLGEAGITIEDY